MAIRKFKLITDRPIKMAERQIPRAVCVIGSLGSALFLAGCPGIRVGGDPSPAGTSKVALKAPEIGLGRDEGMFTWKQMSGPIVVLDTSDPRNPTFSPLESDEETEYWFVVEVEARGITSSYKVSALVPPAGTCLGDRPPVAIASEDFKIAFVDEAVVLNAGNSHDPDFDELTFTWTQVDLADGAFPGAAGPVDLVPIPPAGATFIATEEGYLLFTVFVSDGCYEVSHTMAVYVNGPDNPCDPPCLPTAICNKATRTCDIGPKCTCDDENPCTIDECIAGECTHEEVICPEGRTCDPSTGECGAQRPLCDDGPCGEGQICNSNTRACESLPIADAGVDQTVTAGAFVTVDGSGSFDPDGDKLSCTWVQTQGTEVDISAVSSCSVTFSAPEADATEVLVFELTVDDGTWNDSDNVAVTVLPAAVGFITGAIIDALTGEAIDGAVAFFELESGAVIDTTTATGVYTLEVPRGVPQFIALSATAEGYLPGSANVDTSTLAGNTIQADFALWPDSDEIIVIDTSLHHLGDDYYSGPENSQFQLTTEGLSYEATFMVSAAQAGASTANVKLFAKGVQCIDPIWINGRRIGTLPLSPSDGSFGFVVSGDVNSFLIEGINTLRIESAPCPDDLSNHDDFEFTNIHIVLEAGPCSGVLCPCTSDGDCARGMCCDLETGACTADACRTSVSVGWSNSTGSVDADINWFLPNGETAEINRCGWNRSCAESASRAFEDTPDGLHTLTVYLDGNDWTDLTYAVNFLDYEFFTSARYKARKYRVHGLDLQGNSAFVLFNGWLSSQEPGSGDTTGLYGLEAIGGWRDATGSLDGDVNIRIPTGEWVNVRRHGWAGQGFERALVPVGDLDDGVYQITYYLDGNDWTDATFVVEAPGYRFRADEHVKARFYRTLGIDVQNGIGHAFYNGWLDAEDDLNPFTPRPVEAVVGWRNSTGSVNADINLILPTGEQLAVWRNSWAGQGFERIIWPDNVDLEDGTYRIDFYLDGNDWTDITFQAKFLNWEFATMERVQARQRRAITLEVVGGLVVESTVTNTWKD